MSTPRPSSSVFALLLMPLVCSRRRGGILLRSRPLLIIFASKKGSHLSPLSRTYVHVAFDGRNVRSVVGSPCPQNFSHAGSFPPTGRRALAAGPIGHSYVGQGAMGSASILRVYECTPYHSRRAFSARPTRLFYYCRFHVYFDVYAAQRGLRKNGRTCRGRGRPGV